MMPYSWGEEDKEEEGGVEAVKAIPGHAGG